VTAPREPAPLIVVDDPGSVHLLRARLAGAGWTVVDGFEAATGDWDLAPRRLVCTGSVDTADRCQAALLVAARGAGLLISAPGELPADFLDDLARIGPVERRSRAVAPGTLDAETVDLMRALAAGQSVADAAASALMSLRTAHRRLTAARRALGVGSNRELLTEYARRYGRL
jgi:DNA-binding NarL/FixJ family response regulator